MSIRRTWRYQRIGKKVCKKVWTSFVFCLCDERMSLLVRSENGLVMTPLLRSENEERRKIRDGDMRLGFNWLKNELVEK